jgi:hypothetical protein
MSRVLSNNEVYTDSADAQWPITQTLTVTGPAQSPANPEFYKLPEIEHIFRKPEQMPYRWISLVFSFAVLAPWLFLAKAVCKGGINLISGRDWELMWIISRPWDRE